jgi:hypothetical protein
VGKETDRRWEQGEDMSLVDFKVREAVNIESSRVVTERVRFSLVHLRARHRVPDFSDT